MFAAAGLMDVCSCLHSAPEKLGAEGEKEVQGVREREGEGGGEEGRRGKHLCVCGTIASFFCVYVSFVFSYADDLSLSLFSVFNALGI